MLSIKNIKKTYKNGSHVVHALNDVNINFNVGDFSFILGASGSGKSTLLNILSGLDEVSEGSVEIDGLNTSKFSKKDWAIYRNHYVGFVFQEYNLIDHLTIVENVELPLLFQGIAKKEATERANEQLQKVGLIKFAKKHPRQLSGGQQQRVSIARALVTNPKIIMADEPTGALDSDLSEKVISFLKEAAKDKVVIIVTHDEDLADKFASRIITLEDGKVINDTAPSDYVETVENKLNLVQPKMSYKMLFKFAKNNVASRMFRSLFSSSIVSIGYISIFLLSFLILGINTSISDSVSGLFPEDLYELSHGEPVELTETEMAAIQAFDIVDAVQYNISEYASYNARTTVSSDADLTTIPYDESVFIQNETLFGRLPENGSEILINVQVAEAIRFSGSVDDDSLAYIFNLVEGEEVEIITKDIVNDELVETIEGTYTIVGMYKVAAYMPTIYFNYDELLTLSEAMNDGEITYRDNAVAFLNSSNENKIEELKTTLRDDYDIVINNTFSTVTDSIENFMMKVLTVFIAISSVTVLVSGILIGLVIYTSILERVKEIGILTAIGARESNIVSIFLIESSLLGLLSSVIAIVIALLLSRFINGLFNNVIQSPLNMLTDGGLDMTLLTPNFYVIVAVVLFSILYSMLAGLIPSLKSAHLNAIQALRKE